MSLFQQMNGAQQNSDMMGQMFAQMNQNQLAQQAMEQSPKTPKGKKKTPVQQQQPNQMQMQNMFAQMNNGMNGMGGDVNHFMSNLIKNNK